MLTRRRFIISSAMLGSALLVPKLRANASSSSSHKRNRKRASGASGIGPQAEIPGGTLNPTTITKYADPLVVPPPMPKISVITGKNGEAIDYYEIAVRQFEQQILPSVNFGKTTVWSYGSVGQGPEHAGTLNYPAYTIEGQVNRPIRVKWINDLKGPDGKFLPHLFAIDQTLHWANPGGGEMMRDHRGEQTAVPYTGPVPIVTHVHGAHTHEESDGNSEAWYLPAATNIDPNFAKVGSHYAEFKQKAEARQGQTWDPGSCVFEYPNDQRAGTNWYHDHAIGMTRNNVYAGPAGFYILRGGSEDLQDGSLPAGIYEVPIAVQDRSFSGTADGAKIKPSLFYPTTREFFDGAPGTYIPNSDISPIWNPEFFGNVMVVNGKSWPKFQVERRRYRVRFLNGCNSRFVILRMLSEVPGVGYVYPVEGALPFWQIGAEGGFLDQPAKVDKLLMSPAERADVIIDFSKVPATVNSIYLINEGPDVPFSGGIIGVDFVRSDLSTTGQVMRFDLVAATSPDTSTDPASLTQPLNLPARQKLGDTNKIRRVALLEMESSTLLNAGPREAVLGVVGKNLLGFPTFTEKSWGEPITETPLAGDTEIWEIFNTTSDAHPIHLHQVMFEVVNREDRSSGIISDSELTEKGYKDTVIAYPDQITRIKARFDIPGLYAWHCHIVEHEDNEMMRPFRVLNRINMPLISK